MHHCRLWLQISLLFLAMLTTSARGAGLRRPNGEPILTVSGNISVTNVNGTAVFDREMLEGLGLDTIVTKTPWHDGETEFQGVRMDKLMALVGAKGNAVTAAALNDYVTTIPISDFSKYKVIMALKRNGNYMSVREMGPLFIIYPFDSDPDIQTQQYFGRSVWQVAKLYVTGLDRE